MPKSKAIGWRRDRTPTDVPGVTAGALIAPKAAGKAEDECENVARRPNNGAFAMSYAVCPLTARLASGS